MSCELCTPKHAKELWRNDNFYLIDASNDVFPCYLRLVSTKHVAEMTDLSPQARQEAWKLLELIESAIRDALHPDKVNHAQFGNMVPHLHFHVIARWKDDAYFPESPWGVRQREELPLATEERQKRVAELLSTLPSTLTLSMGKR